MSIPPTLAFLQAILYEPTGLPYVCWTISSFRLPLWKKMYVYDRVIPCRRPPYDYIRIDDEALCPQVIVEKEPVQPIDKIT